MCGIPPSSVVAVCKDGVWNFCAVTGITGTAQCLTCQSSRAQRNLFCRGACERTDPRPTKGIFRQGNKNPQNKVLQRDNEKLVVDICLRTGMFHSEPFLL